MIPKKIHYCWFGRNELPPLAKKCIKSWEKYCKGYEIIRWDESNFDVESSPLYVKQAYEAKKWAFVTDYVRLCAMTKYGGIYMDTDVEVLRPLDCFLEHKAFSGFESESSIPTGIMACEKDFSLFCEFLKYYDDVSLYDSNGNLQYITNVTIMTNICVKKGLKQNNTFQIIDGFVLYPKDYFCPVSHRTGKLKKTKNTYTIHWFAGSWLDEKTKAQFKEKRKKNRKQDRRDKLKHLPNTILKTIVGDKRYNKLKSYKKR